MGTDGTHTDPAWAEELFLRELATIDRAVGFACRHGRLPDGDADDFASFAKLKLIENDYAIIRKFENRSTFAAFITVVVQRMLIDYRIAQWGKWHASTQARRLGEAAVTIEAMIVRDGQSVDEVLPALRRRWPELDRARVEAVVRQLPARRLRPRTVEITAARETDLGYRDDEGVFQRERTVLARKIADIVRLTMSELEERTRLIFRLRFEGQMSVAEISRTLGIEQKPLYRGLQRALLRLRQRLEDEGIRAADVREILDSRGIDFDFGFEMQTGVTTVIDEDNP